MANWTERAKNSIYTRLENGNIRVENACIFWTNFGGRPTNYNAQGGKRCFNLALTPEVGTALREEGWNIKVRPPKEEGDEPLYYTEIGISYNRPPQFLPRIYRVNVYDDNHSLTLLPEDAIGLLDGEAFVNIDLEANPYSHGVRNASGSTIKGSLCAMWVTPYPPNNFGGKYDGFENLNA